MTDDRAYRARTGARRLVADLGAAGPEPGPLTGVRAAAEAVAAVEALLGEHARAAREQGRTWAEVAAVLPGDAGAVAAFARVSRGGAYVPWRCASCGCLVRDYGPELPPAEAEQGHGAGCGRLAATVAAWDAAWDAAWGEDGGGG